MATMSEIESWLSSHVDGSVDWTVDMLTDRTSHDYGTTGACVVDWYPNYQHKYSLVSVDLTWYANYVSKGVAAVAMLYLGIEAASLVAAEAGSTLAGLSQIIQAISIATFVAFVGDVATHDTYTFGGREYDIHPPYTGRDYPMFAALAGVGYGLSMEECKPISTAGEHPASI